MADTNLNTSISAVATRILNAVATANADELTKLASAALFVGESENELIETAINTRVNTLITNADADTVRKLASAIKKMKTAPQSDIVTGGVGDISELTDTQGLLNAGGTSIDISDTAPISPTAGDLWFDSTELTTYVYYDDGSSSQWVNITPVSTVTESTGGGGTTVYATVADLPIADNETGALAFVSENNRLYLWNGSGWYNIALINTNPTITNISGTGIVDGVCKLDDTNLTPTVITITAVDPEGLPLTFSATTDTNFDGLATISQTDNVFTVTPKDQATATTNSGSVTFIANDGVNVGTDVLLFGLEFTSGNFHYMTGYVVSGQQNSANYSTTQTATQAAYPSDTVYYGIVPWEATTANATNNTATTGQITDWRENNGSTGALGYNYDGGFDISSCGRYGAVSGWTSTNSSAIGIFDRANIDAWHNYAAASANTTSRGSISIGTLRGGAGSAGSGDYPALAGWPMFNADGTKLWCGDNCIIEITMNTPYSLSGSLNVDYTVKKYHPSGQGTATYIGTFITLGSANNAVATPANSVGTQSTDETVWTFSLDGTKFYYGQRNFGMLQYALGTPYDLDTASYEHHVNTFTDIKSGTNYTLGNGIGYSMSWMADGHTFVLGQGGGGTSTRRDVYHVTTPWDISTISQRGDGYSYSTGTYFHVDPFTNAHILAPVNSDGVFYQDTAASDVDLGTKIDPRDWPRVATYSGTAPNSSMTAFDLNEDGTKLYWTSSSYDTIYQATLSTPYDTSTAYDVDQLPDNHITNILAMKIKNAGQYLYVADQISRIYRLTLPTPYDITSHSTYTDPNGFQGYISADVGQVYTFTNGDAISMEFNDTGTRLFYVKNGNQTSMYWVDLSTPWDLSTVGSENSIDILSFGSSTNYYPYSASLTSHLKFAFYKDGSNLYVTTSHAAGIGYVFELATPWDMNTATLIPLETVNNFRGLIAGAGGNNVHIDNTGSKLVTTCHNNSGIKTLEFKKYDPSPWPIKYLQT